MQSKISIESGTDLCRSHDYTLLDGGAGEGVLDDDWPGGCIVAPSGPLTETFGISGWVALLTGGETAPGFRAPGGTYALVPRTTAPYL